MPRLSVIVPVYGTEKHLRTCLDSLMTQTLKDAEFILVNDASPDHSASILTQYAERDPRFTIITHEKNRGLFAARVTGAHAAKGEYIAFLDSDDYVSVDFYRAAVAQADTGSFDIVMGDTVWVQSDGSMLVRPVHRDVVPDEPLYGAEVRRAFYGQELSCYTWHTIWNKVFRKTLFDRCLPYFDCFGKHIIMTEDIAFSSVLMYEAESFCRIDGDGVFYCMHDESSTNAAFADTGKFFKNYTDIVEVFDFVETFLKQKQDSECLEHLKHARRWYCRMWSEARQKCASRGDALMRANELTARLAGDFQDDSSCDNGEIWWFDRQTLPWNDGYERIKRAIAGLDGHEPDTISFDVFDTLIQRPFRQPSDLFCMLEDQWQKENRRCIHSFAAARAEADSSVRAWKRETHADVPLTDIYEAMRLTAGASEDCTDSMCEAERNAEISFCRPRKSGISLYRLAKALGKRVILISDMYLDKETISAMLQKCGISGWDAFFLSSEENALKWNGALYQKAIDALQIRPDTMLHIGDNWHNDFLAPRELGIHTLHHPRAMDVMTDPERTRLGQLGMQSVASFGGQQTLQSSLSFRCMQALAATKFFDYGFRATSRNSAFSGSPAIIGYYALGGHLLSLAQWVIEQAQRDGIKKLVFLARDGSLIKQAVDHLLPEDSELVTVECPASRRCLLPALSAHPSDFYALPINIPAYNVRKLLQLLSFCTKDGTEEELRSSVESAGFSWEELFPGKYRYIEFIRWYLNGLYDGRKHQIAYNTLRDYYEPILTDGCACFDMGYSGRLQAALNQLAGHSIPVYYVHDDQKESPRLARAYEYHAACFYGIKPGMSGAFREFLLSSDEPPCTGFIRSTEGVAPVYGKSEYNQAAHAFISIVQRNALQFVKDYTEVFQGTPAETAAPQVCSMPFEDTLRYLSEEDLSLLLDIRFEDTVFAGRDDLDLAALVRDQAAAANADSGFPSAGIVGFVPSQTPLIKRTIGFLLFDRQMLKEKVKKRLSDHPLLFKAGKIAWQGMKKARSFLRKGGQ